MLNKQLETVFVTKSIAPAGLRAYQIRPFQLGILDTETGETVDQATYCPDKQYQFIYGTPSKGANHPKFGDIGNAKLPIRSLTFGRFDKAHKFTKATDERKLFEAYLGYNGISDCKGLSLPCGQNFALQVRAIGKDVRDVFGIDYSELLPFKTGCCGECALDEEQPKIAQAIIDAFNSSFYVKNFGKAELVKSCCPAEAPFAKTDFFDFCMSVCDEGDSSALADVQEQYPDYEVTRKSRKDGISTYQVECVLTSPIPFVKKGTTAADCGACGAGYTLVPASKSYIVTIDNDGLGTTPATWLTEVQAVLPLATSANKLGFANGVSTYQVELPGSFVPAPPYADTTITFIGEREAYCVETTPTSTPWTQCGTKYKITRKLCLTVKNGDCNETQPDLAKIQEMYVSDPNIVPGSIVLKDTNDCLSTYELEQYSNCLEDGCDTYGKDGAKFVQPAPYGFTHWKMCDCEGWSVDGNGCPVPPVESVDTCLAGVKFTGSYFDVETGRCSFNPFDQMFTEPIILEVSIVSNEPYNACDVVDIPWTITQKPSFIQGLGQKLLKDEIISRNYDAFHFINPSQPYGHLLAERMGYEYGADPNKLYNYIYLYHNHDINRTHLKFDHHTREMIVIAIEAEKTELFAKVVNFVNGTLLNSGVCKLL